MFITTGFLQGNAVEHNRGSMQMKNFVETGISPSSQNSPDIFQCDLNSVLLYDHHLIDPDTPKNILFKAGIAQFSKMLQVCSSRRNPFLSIDKEKGKIHGFKSRYVFYATFPNEASVA